MSTLETIGSWSYGASMPTGRMQFGIAVVGDEIFCIGGARSRETTMAQVEAYNYKTNTWRTGMKPLPTPRRLVGCFAIDGKIHCIGGRRTLENDEYAQNIHEIYDVAADSWSEGPSLPGGLVGLNFGGSSGILYQDKIYFLVNNCYTYNPQTASWETRPVSPTVSTYGGLAVYNDKIYAKQSGTRNRFEIFNPADDTVETTVARSSNGTLYGNTNMVIVCYKEQLYLAGQDLSNKHMMAIYDIANDSWTHGIPTPDGNPIVSLVELEGKFYCLGQHNSGIQDEVWIYTPGTPAVTHKYIAKDNTVIRPYDIIPAVQGKDHTASAPFIRGYKRLGHYVDGYYEELIPGTVATISNVQTDHTIYFVYEKSNGEEPEIIITEEYRDSGGNRIAPDTQSFPAPGDTYQRTAPILEGYKRTGHRVDGGELSTDATARLENVQTDHLVTFLYEPDGGQGGGDYDFTITETYLDEENGVYLLPSTYAYLDAGDSYAKTAPALEGYKRTGHRIDGGGLSTGATARLDNVQADHLVTFLYEPDDGQGGGDADFVITESYYDVENEAYLRPDTYTNLDAGDSYAKAAPALEGHKRTGHRIDGGEARPGTTARIAQVQRDHHVFFLYRPGEEEGSGGDDGDGSCGKNCCCQCSRGCGCTPPLTINIPVTYVVKGKCGGDRCVTWEGGGCALPAPRPCCGDSCKNSR